MKDEGILTLFIGALPFDRNKGLDTVIEAWAQLPADAGHVWVIGGGQLEFWRAMVRSKGLETRIKILGPSEMA